MSQAATSPNSFQNPKSILADKNHSGAGIGTTTTAATDHNGLHVTFARMTSPKTNNISFTSMMSNQPQSSNSKPKLSPLRRRTDDADGVSKRYASGSNDIKRMSERTDPSSEGNRLRSKSRSRPLEVIQESEVLVQKRSEESIGSIKSTSTRKGEKSSKSRKHTKVSVAKAASKNPTDSFKRSKPKKKLKKRMKATVAANDAQENDMDSFKPAKLNEEYASELGKITQILRAVSIFDASTSSPPGHTSHKVSLGSQDGRAGTDPPNGIHGESPRRPLSAVELKQLLSSITRVVSLHQLPINGPPPPGHQDNVMTSSQAPTTTSANPTRKGTSYMSDNMSSAIGENSEMSQNLKKKKSKRTKLASFVGSYGEKEANKTKSRSSSKAAKSRASVRKPRSKLPRERKITSGRARSEGGSSVSSTEKDPVQNAAFLRKYFEESTRLANQVSDEDLNLEDAKPKKKKGKKKKGSSKKLSKKSSTVEKKSSQQAMQTSAEQPKSEGGGGGGATGIDNTGKGIPNEITIQENLVPTIRQLLDSAYAQINPDQKGESSKKGGSNHHSNKSSSSNVSSTGGPVIGGKRPISSPNNSKKGTSEIKLRPSRFLKSERSNSRVRSKSNGPSEGTREQPNNDLIDLLVKRFGREEGNTVQFRTGPNNTSLKSQNTDPMKNSGSARTPIKQFETIEDVINSKFSGDTSKMKSIWDKTPYQPMTHERFKDLVSMYASTKTTTDDYIISEEKRRKQKSPVIPPTDNQITSKAGGKVAPFSSNKPGVGNLLTLPKSWEIEEHTMELTKREPTITQLQPPPRNWADSDATSTYNRINFDFNDELDSMRQTDRTKQKLQEQTARQKKYHMKGPIGGPYINLNAPKDFDIFTLYKDAMKKQENR